MSQALTQYLVAVRTAIENEDGSELRSLMDLNHPGAMQGIFEAQQRNPRFDPSATCSSRLGGAGAWGEVFSGHCQCLGALLKGNRAEAYDYLKLGATAFMQAFREDTTAWTIPLMFEVAHNIRSVATTADAELRRSGKKPAKLLDAGGLLQKCFSAAAQGHGNKAKRLATLEIVNTLFKIYFSLNTLRLCKNLIKSVDSPQIPSFDNFPLAQQVTYRFYVGRLAVFDEDYARAEEFLSFAFENCDPKASANQKLILKYLVPVQMLLGVLPTLQILQKYDLEVFADISEAMKSGSIRLFNKCMDRNQDIFIQAGTFLLLEKLKMAIYRRLFRKVAAIHKEMEPAKASQIPIGLFQAALVSQGQEMDLDEIECILANLIYRKYIKGYMSHQHRVMVISKQDPFPPLQSTSLVDIN